MGTHSVVLNDGFWRTCSAPTQGPESTTSAGAALSECMVRRSRRIEPNDGGGRIAAKGAASHLPPISTQCDTSNCDTAPSRCRERLDHD